MTVKTLSPQLSACDPLLAIITQRGKPAVTHVTSSQIVDAAGITYRQLDYWARQGYVSPDRTHPGIGYARIWPRAELDVAALIAQLADAGFLVEAAARIARQAASAEGDEPVSVTIVPGLVLTFTGDSE